MDKINSNSPFRAYTPDNSLLQLRVGDISQDRSCIVGKQNNLFLYLGSNNYYFQYINLDLSENGVKWAELTAERHRRLKACQILSVFIPNKATCMPDLYPLPLDVVPTKNWVDAVSCLREDTGVCFSEQLRRASLIENRDSSSPWRLCDSHWSEFGCLATVNEILSKFAISEIITHTEKVDDLTQYGDFSGKFGESLITERCNLRLAHSLQEPVRTYDSGKNTPYVGSVGRRITWENSASGIELHLLIIGNSFSGSGDSSTHLTYWMSRVFSKVTFLHSAHIPTDALDFYKADIIIFQGLERFMTSVPNDNLSATEIESIFFKENKKTVSESV